MEMSLFENDGIGWIAWEDKEKGRVGLAKSTIG